MATTQRPRVPFARDEMKKKKKEKRKDEFDWLESGSCGVIQGAQQRMTQCMDTCQHSTYHNSMLCAWYGSHHSRSSLQHQHTQEGQCLIGFGGLFLLGSPITLVLTLNQSI